jgi:F-type H+-transporting ATPase subunit b
MISFNETFWVAIAFLLFVAFIYKIIKNLVLSGLDNKIQEIKDSLSKAEQLKEEANKLLSEIKNKEAKLADDAKKIIEYAKNKISKLESDSSKNIEKETTIRTNLLHNTAQLEKDNFLRESTQSIVDNAFKAIEEILKKQDNKFYKNFTDQSIDELKQKNF